MKDVDGDVITIPFRGCQGLKVKDLGPSCFFTGIFVTGSLPIVDALGIHVLHLHCPQLSSIILVQLYHITIILVN